MIRCIVFGHRMVDRDAATLVAERLVFADIFDWGLISRAAARALYGLDTMQQCHRCGVLARHARVTGTVCDLTGEYLPMNGKPTPGAWW